ncbi:MULTISPECIES: alpha-L-arabinofuranosidase C-terminal domain-containing protein [Streptomyces]|uniref:non-reducing end alpha-L-arabinofuranosidase n=1 Tax=Streptomyces caniscabiei TaxID=2746961 RepID=A0ABU4MHF3_9ACTN|nr:MULTISPECIES: alpha-L-arabinofuranosidase C-terminal domain-containing protein [Streptomyces]MBE4736601.1 carbohydrate binding domain-containing protein [Streptomyces caniscabiei]MBE4761853.1 carbohydrate binding domain-containing protein [Streptomyces caniscabiei]MBE4770525.1 carbohydrate binding domain-containing protein [Streptomyces caniscabiei]MBE4786372.1 carbohydrate binding domain-containing protein [Streptomyces caniscabiei]MBE4796501.1 carbohydrate binding domain-containing protei
MSRSSRTRWRLGLTATAFLVAAASVPAPAHAEDVTDYAITVDPAAKGAKIDDTMYGVFFEDINRAADGGLYAELVQNRSFEYSTADNRAYTPLTSWTVDGTAQVVNDAGRLNERNRNYLSLGASSAVTNAGYNTGVHVEEGKKYDFSVWARADSRTALTVTLQDADGALAEARRVKVKGGWAKYRVSFKATRTSSHGRLTVASAGAVALDEVSLFPRDTYKGHRNGLRKDLAEKIAALKPGFVRFPGGCLVNTGSMQDYSEASNWERKRSYQWKDTIGPVEQRATNANFWGYNQSYGLGYYEYFQFSEDIGAMPLPVVPALVTGCGQNKAVDDEALLQRHIQDTLDLIEFANGPVTSTWGKKRARMGHPKPFHLTHLGVGNEENLPNEFFARFQKFRAAIEAKYPDIKVISNSGPDDTGTTFDTAWQLNREANVDMVDEHYYNSPQWFLQNNDRYDSYDRKGPKVFLGEYASQGNAFKNALSEAAFMTGLERNADIVKLASYAPLLANEDYVQWRPDMIWFNNHASWNSASYETQKLFMNNVGDRVVPSTATGTPSLTGPITGAVGLSTWATTAAYDDVTVTAEDGTSLLSDDFSGDASKWTHTGGGSWSVQDGQYAQTDVAAENTMVTAGDTAWHDYDLKVKATKKSGKEGFLVAFGVKDTGNFYWWNLGGWNNTTSAVEQAVDGGKSSLISKPGTIETGRTYDIEVEVRGRKVTLLLDGKEWGSFTDDKPAEPFRQVVTRDAKTGDLILKVVNAQGVAARTAIDLGGAKVRSKARVTTLTAAPDAVNTETATPVAPVKSTFSGVARKFSYTFPANSVTFLRIKKR